MKRAAVSLSAAFVLAGMLAAAGCRPLYGLEEGPGPNERDGAAGSGGDEGPWWVEGSGSCEIPKAPTAEDRPAGEDSGEDSGAIYLALTKVRTGTLDSGFEADNEAWRNIGFDLDRHCTDVSGCSIRGGASCQKSYSDGYGCRDNAIGYLTQFAPVAVPDITEAKINCEVKRGGGFNIILRLTGYNGRQDDQKVRIDVYSSVRKPVLDCATEAWRGRQGWWDGNEEPLWPVMPESIAESGSRCAASGAEPVDGLDDSKVCTTDAFVRNGYLAGMFEDGAEFWLNGQETESTPGFRTTLSRAYLVGRLSKESRGWGLFEAVLGGATTVDDMLEGFYEVGFCRGACSNDVDVRDSLEGARDLLLEPSSSGSEECNALSVGWAFEARETRRVEVDPRAAYRPRSWPLGCTCLSTDAGAEAGVSGSDAR